MKIHPEILESGRVCDWFLSHNLITESACFFIIIIVLYYMHRNGMKMLVLNDKFLNVVPAVFPMLLVPVSLSFCC